MKPSDDASRSQKMALNFVRHSAIDAIADEWDRLVPRDKPHFRAGFLRAVERSGMMQDPAYMLVSCDGRLIAVALAYTVLLDTTMSASEKKRQFVARIRKRFKGFGWRPMRICGSPVSNGESGISFDPQLSPDDRRLVFNRIVQEVLQASTLKETIYFKEFTDEAVAEFASESEQHGFFAIDPGPGTALDLKWSSWDDYLSAMRKRYRRRVRADLKAAEDLEFELFESFAELAPTTAALYADVVSRAEYNMEQANEKFFAEVSEFDQASLLVARLRSSGQVLGANLLLFGDNCMHNLYIGFDYASNEQFHTYFSIVEHSLRLAMEKNCRICYLGPASYEFKARLGAVPFPLTAYMKHRMWPIHALLRSSRDKLFEKSHAPTHDVFQSG
jgi:hypothetical protein